MARPLETFHLLVDRGQQFREDHIQFVARGADHWIAEHWDSIIEATQRHEKERARLCTVGAVFPAKARYRTYCRSRMLGRASSSREKIGSQIFP